MQGRIEVGEVVLIVLVGWVFAVAVDGGSRSIAGVVRG